MKLPKGWIRYDAGCYVFGGGWIISSVLWVQREENRDWVARKRPRRNATWVVIARCSTAREAFAALGVEA